MNKESAVLVIEDLSAFEFINRTLKNIKDLGESICGVRCYQGTYKDLAIRIFFIEPDSLEFMLAIEHLFLFEKIDFLIYLGHCFSSIRNTNSKIGDLVFINSVFVDEEKSICVDLKLEKSFMEASKNTASKTLKSLPCKYFYNADEISAIQFLKFGNCCFDNKSFLVYSMANRYNKKAICLCKIKNFEYLNFQDYVLHREENELDDLIVLALEFNLRCSRKT